MKVKIEPERFSKLLDAAMLKKTKPMLDPIKMTFFKDYALVADNYFNVIGIYLKLDKSFFLEYEVETQTKKDEDGNETEIGEEVTFSSDITKIISWKKGFGNDPIEISSDDKNKITIKSKNSSFTKEIERIEGRGFKFDMIENEYGAVPSNMEDKSAVLIKAEEFDIPVSDQYEFEFDGTSLKVQMSLGGKLVHELSCKAIGKEKISFILNGEYLLNILENLSGEVKIFFHENVITFAENKKDYKKTYFVCTLAKDE